MAPKKGYKHTEEAKEKIRLSRLGKKNSEASKEKNRLASLGHPVSEVTRAAVSRAQTGKKLSQEHIEKLRQANLGHKRCVGRVWTDQKREKILNAISGQNNYRWIHDRTKVKQYWTERNNPEYKQWRKSVWSRDSFRCKLRDENCKGRIEAHHILNYQDHLELRYQINNGITLCHAHHPRTRAEEKRLEALFMSLVSVSSE